MNSPYWFELAVMFGFFAVGLILFGQFDAENPRCRLMVLLRFFLGSAIAVIVSATAGRAWFFGLLGALTAAIVIVHLWWLPKHGIKGWTLEPRDKYCAWRGRSVKPR